MDVRTATAAEMQTNFAQYLGFVANGGEVIVTENGKEIGRFVPSAQPSAAKKLTGILKKNMDPDKTREEALRKKYAHPD